MTDDGQARGQGHTPQHRNTRRTANIRTGMGDARREGIATAKQATEKTRREKKQRGNDETIANERQARERHGTQATQANRTHARKRQTGTTPAHPPTGGRGTIRGKQVKENTQRGGGRKKRNTQPRHPTSRPQMMRGRGETGMRPPQATRSGEARRAGRAKKNIAPSIYTKKRGDIAHDGMN